MILKKADVFIKLTGTALIEVKTNEQHYQTVKNVLMTLKTDFGLPVECLAENLAESIVTMKLPSSNVLVLNGVKVHKNLDFLIAAWEIGIRSTAEIQELADEIAQHLKPFDLSVSIMSRKTQNHELS